MAEARGGHGSSRSRGRIIRLPARTPWIAIASFTSLAFVTSCLVGLVFYSNDDVVKVTLSSTTPSPTPSPSPRVTSPSSVRLRGGEDVRTTIMSSHADRRLRGTDDKSERDDQARSSRLARKTGDLHNHINFIRRGEVALAEAEAGNEDSGMGGRNGGNNDDPSSLLHSHPGKDNEGKGKARYDVRGRNHLHRGQRRAATDDWLLANTTFGANTTKSTTNSSIGGAEPDDEEDNFDDYHLASDHQHSRGADDRLVANTTSSNATRSTTNSSIGVAEPYDEQDDDDIFDDYHLAPTQMGDDDGTMKRLSWGSNQTQPPVLVPEARIIGGSAIDDEGRHPYLAAVFRKLPKNRLQHVCGGTLVAPNVVLSAAHCHEKFRASVVRLGETDLRSSDEDRSMEEFDIVDTIVHPDYDGVRKDFVLFVLDGTSRYAPISLNEGSNRPRVGRNLYVMGWGQTSPGKKSSSSPVAREVLVQAVSNDDCDDMYGRRLRVTDDMLCASSPGRDACDGDSGGPAIIRGDNPGEDLLVGVVSQGIECANPKYPGVYARVSSVVDWIWGWLDAIEANGGDDDGADSYNGGGHGGNSPRESDGDGGGQADEGQQDATKDGDATDDPTDVKKNENDNEQGRRSDVEKTGTAGDCEDAEGSFPVSGRSKKRDCSWVGKDRGKRCDDFSELCPMTCGTCGDR